MSKLLSSDIPDALNSSKDIIERRINFFGVSEPLVQTIKAGDKYRIIVELPGVKDTDQAIALLGQNCKP